MLDILSMYGLLVRHVDWSSIRSLEIQNYNFDLANPGESTVIGTTYGAPLDDFWRLLPTQNQCINIIAAMPQLTTLMLVGNDSGLVFLSALAGTQLSWNNGEERGDELKERVRIAHQNPGLFMKVGLKLTTFHLHNMSLGLAAASLENEANELTDHLEALLRSRQARGLPILKLHARQLLLAVRSAAEAGNWRAVTAKRSCRACMCDDGPASRQL
jgi:hypothetical protein